MNDILPVAIQMQMAIKQQNVALSMIKKNAEMEQQLANMLLEGIRGSNINITA